MTIYSDYGFELMNQACAEADEFICGTEYEIEDIHKVLLPDFNIGGETPYWFGDLGAVKDGSLRNNGMEFVTRPVTFDRALELFDYLHVNLKLGSEPYTHRTSTHVHVNVASMSMGELKHFVMLYALFEPVFFKYAGTTRQHNIHCVPLSYTLLPKHYASSVNSLVDMWSKYTAFNLKPVKTQGTVEFRHLYGTGDKKVYQQWLTMLKELWEFAHTSKTTWLLQQLKANMSPTVMLLSVIPSALSLQMTDADFEDSLVDVKLAFV